MCLQGSTGTTPCGQKSSPRSSGRKGTNLRHIFPLAAVVETVSVNVTKVNLCVRVVRPLMFEVNR